MFGNLRYNIGTARNSNGPVPFACIKRKQGNFKPELPFQNNTGLPWTASQKLHSFLRLDGNFRKWALHFHPIKDCICMKQTRVNVKLESVSNHYIVESTVAGRCMLRKMHSCCVIQCHTWTTLEHLLESHH